MEQNFEYFAFISYKREDEKWAKWLQSKLETYKLPTIIARERPELPRKLNPVFKDTTDIKTGILVNVLAENLQKSKYLIVICSPLAAKSKWVGKEISDFISFGKQNNIILFIIDGIPYSNNPENECIHSLIKAKLPEMLGVNINEESKDWKYIKKQKAFIRVVATLLDVSFDSLWQRQKRRIINNWIMYISGLFIMISTLIGVTLYQTKVNEPFDVNIALKEITFHNTNLPFENGVVKLCYDKDTLISKPINAYNQQIVFTNIPGKFKGKKANVSFEIFGYEKVDSTINLNNNIEMMIKRDNTFSSIKGIVIDNNGKPIQGAAIIIENYPIIKSNSNGEFEISFSCQDESITKEVEIFKSGFKKFHGTYLVSQDWKVLLESK